MRETADGELCLTFAQSAGKLIPVSFGADGTATVELKAGFRVVLRMADDSEVSADRSEAQFDMERSMYYYLIWFPTTQRPETIVCIGPRKPQSWMERLGGSGKEAWPQRDDSPAGEK